MSDRSKHLPRGRIRRLGRMVGMSARMGGDLVGGKLKQMLGNKEDPRIESARTMLSTLGTMKGLALKIGQTVSMASAHLPAEVRDVVSQMFSQVPYIDYSEIASVVERELGSTPDKIFSQFDPEPFAAASLGQVHRAVLPGGQVVAVKVQYPNVEEALREDLQNFSMVVKTLGLGGNIFNSKAYFEEVQTELMAELDYRRELNNLQRFRTYAAQWPELAVPQSFDEWCTERVLVLEYLEGVPLHEYTKDIDAVAQDGRFNIACSLIRSVYGPFLRHGAIQADTHPGNYVVCGDGRLGLLDFGSIKQFTKSFQDCYRQAICGALRGEDLDLLTLVREGGFTVSLSNARAQEVLMGLARIVGRPLKGHYDFGSDQMMEDVRAYSVRHVHELVRIRPPPEAILFYRAVAGLAHNMRLLRPTGDFRPVFAELVQRLSE